MTENYIFTSLVIPTTANGPSPTNLQWSEDGQAFMVTRSGIYILTPSTGISFDPSSVVSVSLAQSTNKNVKGETLSWYRNMIELEKVPIHQWPLESQEWGTVSLGSLDLSWTSITISPTNITNWSSCVIVALNTNMEVSLWAPLKNYLTGEWLKVQDITRTIKDLDTSPLSPGQKTLNAQVRCISWSGHAHLAEGVRDIDGSLLALGNRAGRIIFMQYYQKAFDKGMQLVASLSVADDWVIHLAWSPWLETGPGCFRAILASGIADGSIVITSVSLSVETHTQQPENHPRLDLVLMDHGRPCCPPDGSPVTALTWVDSGGHAPILAYAKPGVVFLQKMPSVLPLGWSGTVTLTLQTHTVSSSSSSFAPVSGFLYLAKRDALLLSLYDGSFHMIHCISTSPTLDTSIQNMRSSALTSQVRNIFALAEGKVTFLDVNRTIGILDYDGAGSIGWLAEKCRPDDFSYKHDAKHLSMFVVTRLWKDEILELLVSKLQQITSSNMTEAPTHVLRGVFLHLRDKTFVEAHQVRLIELLIPRKRLEETSAHVFRSNDSGLSVSKIDFGNAVAATLFRRRDIRSFRLKLGVSMFCSQVRGPSSQAFEKLVAEWLNFILCFQLLAVLRQMERLMDQLEGNDLALVHYWIMRCLVQESPHLQQEAAVIANRVGMPIDPLYEKSETLEICPACHTVIPKSVGNQAVCPNGHLWERCSITSFILTTPFVRTCVGCGRKALLSMSQRSTSEQDGLTQLPVAAKSDLVQVLLEASRWCIFCGNRFVRVL